MKYAAILDKEVLTEVQVFILGILNFWDEKLIKKEDLGDRQSFF